MTAQQRPADVRVALLRGINVGRAKRVAMADLRAIVESLGYLNVRTVLNRGNVVFTVPAGRKGDAAVAIEQAIATGLGVQSRVIVITAADVCEIVTKHPLTSLVDKPSRLQVLVLADPARRRSRPLRAEPGVRGDDRPEGEIERDDVGGKLAPGGHTDPSHEAGNGKGVVQYAHPWILAARAASRKGPLRAERCQPPTPPFHRLTSTLWCSPGGPMTYPAGGVARVKRSR